MDISSTDRICIAGSPGTGKTTFLRFLLRMAEPSIYIVDPLNQYEEFGDVGEVTEGKKRIVPQYETSQEFERICKKFWTVSNTVLAVEEAEQFLPEGRPIPPFASGLIRMGRNWGVGIWLTTRRIQDLNKRFFDLCQHVLFFRCGFRSRDYIADMLGAEYMYPVPRPQLNKTGYTISTLPPYHCLDFNLSNETAEVVKLTLISGGARIQEVGRKSDASREAVAAAAKQIALPEAGKKIQVQEKTLGNQNGKH